MGRENSERKQVYREVRINAGLERRKERRTR
jgi:hypothetical protein